METKKQDEKQALPNFITLPVVPLSNNQMSQVTGGGVRIA